jgi:signal transduction histidine kinase
VVKIIFHVINYIWPKLLTSLKPSGYFILLLFILFNSTTTAQQLTYKLIPAQYELEHINLNSKQDLGAFADLNEDKDGYLWLSDVKGGLSVFDGNRTITYKNGNGVYSLLPDSTQNQLEYIQKTSDGKFWILEQPGRHILFDPYKRKTLATVFKKQEKEELIFFNASSPTGDYYTATYNTPKNTVAIYKINNQHALSLIYETAAVQELKFQYTIAGNYIWLLESNRITRISLDGKTAKRYAPATGLTLTYFVYADAEKLYFISTKQDAIYTWNEGTDSLELFAPLPALVKDRFTCFYVKGDTIYLGANLRLFIINRAARTIQNLSPDFLELAKKEAPNSLASEALLRGFFQRADGSLLFCTRTDLYRLKKKMPDENDYKQVTGSSTDPRSFRAIAEDDNQNIYATYYTGILKKKAGTNIYTSLPVEQYFNNDIKSTYGLSYWNNYLLSNNVQIDLRNGKHRYLNGNGFGGHCTHYLQNDTLWFINWVTNELHAYDLQQQQTVSYPLDKSVSQGVGFLEAVADMKGDASGQNLWLSSTRPDGLSLISKKGKLIKQYSTASLKATGHGINEIEVNGNTVWYGCADGLGLLDATTGNVTMYKIPLIMNNGVLKNREVFSLLPDTAGNFYLGSNHGLLYFNIQSKTFYTLPQGHPLSVIEFNKASNFKASDGRYYFGTTNGLYSFTANELEFVNASNQLKLLKLYAISIFDSDNNQYSYQSESPDSTTGLVLKHFNNNIELEFSVPEFNQTVYYSYRLKGQNNNWSEYKAENKILINGLQPGSYTLEVKASTSSSDENARYFSLPIYMKQVWYKKWWVITLFASLLVGLLIAFIRYRFQQTLLRQKELASLRTKISSDLHDDVGTLLSGLAMQSQMLTYTAKEEQKQPLKEISSMSRDAMERMRDTVWAMDSRKDKVENLIDRMRDYAERNLPLKKMTHTFTIAAEDSTQFIDPEKRQQLYLIFKEAITNILKHSNGNDVQIHFTADKHNMQITVKDNGSKKEETHSDGLGMSNMKMRAEKIGARFTAKYEEGFVVMVEV